MAGMDQKSISPAAICSILVVFLTLGVAVYRWDMGTDLKFLLSLSAYSISILLVAERLSHHHVGKALGVMAIMALPVAVRFSQVEISWVWIGVAAMAAWPWRHRYPSKVNFVILTACGAALTVFVFGSGTINPLSWERAVLGLGPNDSLAHFSLTQMLALHNTVTLGIDGVAHPLAYHFGSHLWLGSVAGMLGTSIPRSFHIVYIIVVYPVIIFSILNAADYISNRALNKYYLLILTLAIIFIMPITDWESYRYSESHLLSVALILLHLPLILYLWRGGEGSSKILFLAVPFTFPVLVTKISTGLILCVAYGLALLIRHGMRSWAFWLGNISLASAALFSLGKFAGAGQGAYQNRFMSFAFYRVYGFDFSPLYYLHAMLPCVLAIAGILWIRRTDRTHWLGDGWFALFIGALTLAGALPGLVVDLEGAAAWYFLDAAKWISVPICVVIAVRHGRGLLQAGGWTMRLGLLLAGASILVTGMRSAKDAASFFASVRWYSIEKSMKSAEPRKSWTYLLDRHYWQPGLVAAAFESTPAAKLVSKLTEAGSRLDRPTTAVWVPPDTVAFWTLMRNCTGSSLVAPGLVGLPMIYGLGPQTLCGDYPAYDLALQDPMARTTQVSSVADVCHQSRKYKFKTILRVNYQQDWNIDAISCLDN